MTRQESKDRLYFKVPTFIGDFVVHCLSYFAAFSICKTLYHGNEFLAINNWGAIAVLILIAYSSTISITKLKLAGRQIPVSRVAVRAVLQVALFILLFFLLFVVIYKVAPRSLMTVEWAIATLAITFWHLCITYATRILRKRGRNTSSMIFVGADRNNMHIMHHVLREKDYSGYRIIGAFSSDFPENIPSGIKHLGGATDAITYLEKHPSCADELYCSLSPKDPDEKKVIDQLVYLCEQQLITFYYVPNMDGYVKRRLAYDEFGGRSILKLHDEPLSLAQNQIIKRAFDLVVSGLFLITVFPLLLITVGLGVKLSSPGPIFFKQKRTGYNGKSFDCYKFRSMRVSADADTKQATADDPRKTKFGDFIRRTSLDEFPQFINVFLGDMSLVGPRPHMEYHTEKYSELISDYMVRHLVRPGITGWAQVNGCRGETKTVEEMADRVEHDIWYLEHWTMMLDIEILFKTVKQILGGDKQAY